MTLETTFQSVFSLIGQVTGTIRSLITSIAADYSSLILLVLSILGGWYLAKRFPKLDGYYTILVYVLAIFLLLRFV